MTGRRLCRHWRKLAARLETRAGAGAAQLREGSDAARTMLSELTAVTAARGLGGTPAAQGFGAQLAGLRNALVDPALEVNQALRLALLEIEHVTTLLAYLERLAGQREDEQLRAFLAGWRERMRAHEGTIRAIAIDLGDEPAAAIAPCVPGLAGRAAHGLANRVGTLGEWFDSRSVR
ncbi:hypothetical protein BH20ACT17_BH20ACT17_06480 [soil metagenome]